MKETAVYFARCNRLINAQMLDTLGKAGLDPFQTPLEGYWFKTLGQILEHIAVSDRIWLEAFADLENPGIDLEAKLGPTPGYGDRVFADFAAYRSARTAVDDVIVEYFEAVDPALFTKTVSRKTRDGQQMDRRADYAVVHFFNHQTHHRGQISLALDERGVENNYSNMIFLNV